MTTPTVGFKLTVNDRLLQENIVRMSAASGRTVKEETRTAFRGIVRDALIYTPPGSQGATGSNAKRQGEAAIGRDLRRMGFVPVEIKGYRVINQAFGRKIEPVKVKTKENPAFAEPNVFHLERLQRSRGRSQVSRGRKQAYYLSRAKFTSMLNRLKGEVGRLASCWVKAADQLAVPVYAWIRRHGTGRGTGVIVRETKNVITMTVIGHFPATATGEAETTQGRLDRLKGYAAARLKRQLPFVLKNKMRQAKRN